jgi:hypothetical protein
MKVADNPPKVIDEVITEVRAIKRAISERHGNDIGRLLDALIAQENSARLGRTEAGTGQPTTCPELNSEDSDKPPPESEGRSR